MAAYYHWINQQRLAGSEQSTFLVWFENHGQALAVSPTLPRGTVSSSALIWRTAVVGRRLGCRYPPVPGCVMGVIQNAQFLANTIPPAFLQR